MTTYIRPGDVDISTLGFPAAAACIDGVTTVTADVDAATLKAAVDAAPPRTVRDTNASTLRTKAQNALTANDTFRATVATRASNIAAGKTSATTISTATVTTVAQAQTQIRAIGNLLVQVATALDDLNTQADKLTAENSAVIRLLLGQLDITAGT